MKLVKFALSFGLLLSQFALSATACETVYEIIICHENGENTVLEVKPGDTFLEIMSQAENLAQNGRDFEDELIHPYKKEFYFDFSKEREGVLSIEKSATSHPRNYDVQVTAKEKEDIAYIVTTLGRGSLKKLLVEKSSLKKAGGRVDHVHPLRFIGCIFAEEELKVGMLQIKERGGWISKEFFNGLYDSFTAEANLQNLKNEDILDFANDLKVDATKIIKHIEARDWKGLINALIELLPRSGNPNRYDM